MRLTFSQHVGGEKLSVDQVVNMVSALGRDDLDVKVRVIGMTGKQIARNLRARGLNAWHRLLVNKAKAA